MGTELSVVSHLRELEAEASPAPWFMGEQHETKCCIGTASGHRATFGGAWCERAIYANAELTVAARNALPLLLAVCEAAEALVDSGDFDPSYPPDARLGDAVRALRERSAK